MPLRHGRLSERQPWIPSQLQASSTGRNVPVPKFSRMWPRRHRFGRPAFHVSQRCLPEFSSTTKASKDIVGLPSLWIPFANLSNSSRFNTQPPRSLINRTSQLLNILELSRSAMRSKPSCDKGARSSCVSNLLQNSLFLKRLSQNAASNGRLGIQSTGNMQTMHQYQSTPMDSCGSRQLMTNMETANAGTNKLLKARSLKSTHVW
mmetsp:Transcript_114880/g.331982  ORF Transcript_114880/g.331982 Transcript_114880/m.331982 type:complete len:205 (-) Transcript_114880:29-643(-)